MYTEKILNVNLKGIFLGNITSDMRRCSNTFLKPFGLTTSRTNRVLLLLEKVFAENISQNIIL